MKNIILIFFCFFSIGAYAQKMPDYGLDKVRLTLSDQTIIAELDPVTSTISAKSNLHYFWYSANAIHETQGGYSGRLLNGKYSAFYLNKNLKEQGNFKKGLKNGVWRSWNGDGSLIAATNWKRGTEIIGKKPPIWKRLPLIRKKPKAVDSLSTPKGK
jgi:hypothetical protein